MIRGLRELLWAVAVLAAAVLLAYVLVVTLPRGSQGEGTVPPLLPSKYDDRFNELDREAVELAYSNQVAFLFSGWMKDPTGQPTRSLNGLRAARKAYVDAMTAIEQRPK